MICLSRIISFFIESILKGYLSDSTKYPVALYTSVGLEVIVVLDETSAVKIYTPES
jgi:hypothetical protein